MIRLWRCAMTGEIISFFGTARSNMSALDNLTLLLWLWNIQRKDQWSILGFDSPEARKPCSGLLRSWICPLISNLTSMTTQVLRHRGTCIIFSHIPMGIGCELYFADIGQELDAGIKIDNSHGAACCFLDAQKERSHLWNGLNFQIRRPWCLLCIYI